MRMRNPVKSLTVTWVLFLSWAGAQDANANGNGNTMTAQTTSTVLVTSTTISTTTVTVAADAPPSATPIPFASQGINEVATDLLDGNRKYLYSNFTVTGL